jgi:hypothetical protein
VSVTRFPLPPNRDVFDVDDPPKLIGVPELAAVWRLSASQIHRHVKRGNFDFLRPTDGIAVGPKKFSGIRLARYLKGEPLYVPSFGRRRAS